MSTQVSLHQSLAAAPEEVNPALAMSWRLSLRMLASPLSVGELVGLAGTIDQAMQDGGAWEGQTGRAIDVLSAAAPVSGQHVPEGF